MNKYFLLIFLFAGISNISFAQGGLWSLERCVKYAQENNISVKQSKVAIEQSELTLQSTKQSRYPNVFGSVSLGGNAGRSIDPTTNEFVTRGIFSNGYGVSANITVYDGGRIKNRIAQNNYNLQENQANLEGTKYDIGLNVANSYLNILMAYEQLDNARNNLSQVKNQLDRTLKLINAGSLPENDKLSLEAEVATNEQIVVASENSVDLSLLNLKLLLQLPPDTDFKVERPKINLPEIAVEVVDPNVVYNKSLQVQPSIKAGEFRKSSAETGVKIAELGNVPTLTFGVGSNTNVSSLDPFQVGYFGQLGQNFYTNAGLSLSIPIYTQGQTPINIDQAKLFVETVELQNEQTKQNLKNQIYTAVADAKAAAKQYQAASKSVNALSASLVNIEKKLNLGAANNFEYTTALNQLENAKINLLIAKYDYLFKLKVLDLYQGKEIKLD